MKFWKPNKPPNRVLYYLAGISVALLVALPFLIIVRRPSGTDIDQAFFLISCIAAITALVTVILASWSLRATEESLRLTRMTTRPFLALQPGGTSSKNENGDIVALDFEIRNSGPVPANLVTADLQFFDNDEEITEDNRSQKYPKALAAPRQVVVFPNYSYHIVQPFDFHKETDRKLSEDINNGKVKLHLRITYTAQGIEYRTVQTEKLEKEESGEITRVPIQPHGFT